MPLGLSPVSRSTQDLGGWSRSTGLEEDASRGREWKDRSREFLSSQDPFVLEAALLLWA